MIDSEETKIPAQPIPLSLTQILVNTLKGLPLDAAATPKLSSTTLGLDKHYAAVKINNEIKTRISKFPRSYSNHFYDFKILKNI